MKIKEKYYKETEYLLYNYKMFKASIENSRKEIEYLKGEDGSTGIKYDGIKISPTFKFSSTTEEAALSNTEKLQYYERYIDRLQSRVEQIDEVMEGLNQREKIVITQRYIEAKEWWQVGNEIERSERTCRTIRRGAIEKIALGIFGEIAGKLPHQNE